MTRTDRLQSHSIPADLASRFRYPVVRDPGFLGDRMQFDQLIGARSYRCSATQWRHGHSARAEQPERMRRIGVVLPATSDDPVLTGGLERPPRPEPGEG
jgi:hypothetical protein